MKADRVFRKAWAWRGGSGVQEPNWEGTDEMPTGLSVAWLQEKQVDVSWKSEKKGCGSSECWQLFWDVYEEEEEGVIKLIVKGRTVVLPTLVWVRIQHTYFVETQQLYDRTGRKSPSDKFPENAEVDEFEGRKEDWQKVNVSSLKTIKERDWWVWIKIHE